MINERDRNTGFFTVALYERNFGSEVSGDFTLPDYYAEIRRILCVTPTVLPPAKYVGDSTAEFNGVVDYVVTYVGGDGEMYSIPLSSDYSFTVPLDKSVSGDIPEEVTALCSIGVDSVNTRVSAPRRLSIRCRIRPNVRVYAKIPTAISCDTEVSVASIHTRSVKGECLTCESSTSDIIPVTYIVPAPAEDTRVVRADAYADVTSMERTSAGLNCRGEVNVKLLTDREESGELAALTGSIPFDGEIDLEKGMDDMSARVRGIISEMSVNVTEQGIECSVGVMLEAICCSNAEVEYTDDIYSTENECECTLKQINVKKLAASATGNFTLSERLPLSDTGLPEDADIIETVASASMDKCEVTGGKYALGGTAAFTVIHRKDGEIFATDVSVPMKYEMDGSADPSDSVVLDSACHVRNIKVKTDGGNLCIDAEIGVSADCVSEQTVSTVEKVTFGAPVARSESELIVCYPSPDDTLWSVAKRYKVAASNISGDPEKDRFVMIE